MALDIVKPGPPPPPEAPQRHIEREQVKLTFANIPLMAFEIVTTPKDFDNIAYAYSMTSDELTHELGSNPHLKKAMTEVQEMIDTEGALHTSMHTMASAMLPSLLEDTLDPDTEPSVRSRNTQIALDWLKSREKIKADAAKAAQSANGNYGMTVQFNVSGGIRGISATAEPINVTPNLPTQEG